MVPQHTIYGGHAQGFRKNYDTFIETDNQLGVSVFVADEDDHARMRKMLNRAFSSSSLRNYDDMMKENARILIQKLDQEQSGKHTAIRINDWFTWIAFDVVATACLGENFDCLRQEPFRGWPGLIAKTWKIIVYASVFKSLVPAASTLQSLLPTGVFLQKEVDKFNLVLNRTKDRVRDCLDGRMDFLSKIARENTAKEAMTDGELLANVTLFMGAGIETVATVLPSLIYLLDRNPRVMEKLVSLLRVTFSHESEVTVQSVASLEYLNACIQEAFRIFPPVAEGLPRVAPPGGCFIEGRWIPGKTFVQVSIFAANMSATNWANPTSFVPERWIAPYGDYAQDQRQSLQPFSLGPRVCIGKQFALGEIRLVLAMLLWHFDVRIPSKDTWTAVPSYMLWEKKPLYVELKPRINAHYSLHSHRGLTTHLVLRGALTIAFPNDPDLGKKTYGVGDRIDVEAGRMHEVWMGDDGCEYVIGE
ncbi:MAG: hypothetical protein Q9173_002509 [Seirophora scorigena]